MCMCMYDTTITDYNHKKKPACTVPVHTRGTTAKRGTLNISLRRSRWCFGPVPPR